MNVRPQIVPTNGKFAKARRIMNCFENSLNQYGLHDTVVDKMFLQQESIVFCFETGIYHLNIDGRLSQKTSACQMQIFIQNLDSEQMYEHVEIKKIKNFKSKEISFDSFLKQVNKNGLEIYLDYYSFFAKALLLKCFVGELEFEIQITEIEKICFVFDC